MYSCGIHLECLVLLKYSRGVRNHEGKMKGACKSGSEAAESPDVTVSKSENRKRGSDGGLEVPRRPGSLGARESAMLDWKQDWTCHQGVWILSGQTNSRDEFGPTGSHALMVLVTSRGSLDLIGSEQNFPHSQCP